MLLILRYANAASDSSLNLVGLPLHGHAGSSDATTSSFLFSRSSFSKAAAAVVDSQGMPVPQQASMQILQIKVFTLIQATAVTHCTGS